MTCRLTLAATKEGGCKVSLHVASQSPTGCSSRTAGEALNLDVVQHIASFVAWLPDDRLVAGACVSKLWRGAFVLVAQRVGVQIGARHQMLSECEPLQRAVKASLSRRALCATLSQASLVGLFERMKSDGDFWRSVIVSWRAEDGADGTEPSSSMGRAREWRYIVVESTCTLALCGQSSPWSSQPAAVEPPSVAALKELLGDAGRALRLLCTVDPRRIDPNSERIRRIRRFVTARCAIHTARACGGEERLADAA